MKLTLEITTGNAAMRTGSDLANALHKLANRLEGQRVSALSGGKIIDANGNSVGSWDVYDGPNGDEDEDDE